MVDLGNLTFLAFQRGVVFPWYTVAQDGHSVAPSTPGTIKLYDDNGHTLVSTAGFTVTDTRDASGVAGSHIFRFVAPVNTLPGVWGLVPGREYIWQLEGAVVDGVTVNVPLARFGYLSPKRDTLYMDVTTIGSIGTSTGNAAGVIAAVRTGTLIWCPPYQTTTGVANGQLRVIETFTAGTGDFALRSAWITAPANGDYAVFITGPVSEALAETDFATDALSARVLAADAATEIAADVGSLTIADGSLTEAKFGTGALSTRVLADAAITDTKIADGTITAAKLATAALTAAKLAADAITAIQSGLATTSGLTPLAKTSDLATLATAAALSTVGLDVDAVQTAVAAVQADTDNLQTRLPAALVGGKMDSTAVVTSLDAGQITAIADAVWDLVDKIEPGLSPKGALRVLAAVFAGLTTGVTGSSPVFKSADLTAGVVQGSKNRVIGVQNATDERTSVTLDTSDV